MKIIIKQGNIKMNYYATCSLCQCEFTYEESDIFLKQELSSWSPSYVTCPCCGHQVSVPHSSSNPWWNTPIIYYSTRQGEWNGTQ